MVSNSNTTHAEDSIGWQDTIVRGETVMPRQLFDDVVEPTIRLGTRQRYTVPLSMMSHVTVLGVLVAAPIVATRALPTPDSVVMFVAAPPLPEAPPPPAPVPVARVGEPS